MYNHIGFILIQLDVQYSLFLKSLLAQHVSDVAASIVRSTTAVYSHRFFSVSGVFIPVAVWNWPWYSDKVSQHHYKTHGINTPETEKNRWLYTAVVLLTMDAATSKTCRANKIFKNKEYCTFNWIRIKHMLPKCTEPQTLKIIQGHGHF
jgi:hypothetical protein